MFINRKGQKVIAIPEDEYIDMGSDEGEVEKFYEVDICIANEDGTNEYIATEQFPEEPTEDQIKWCLFKYMTECPHDSISATVCESYRVVW